MSLSKSERLRLLDPNAIHLTPTIEGVALDHCFFGTVGIEEMTWTAKKPARFTVLRVGIDAFETCELLSLQVCGQESLIGAACDLGVFAGRRAPASHVLRTDRTMLRAYSLGGYLALPSVPTNGELRLRVNVLREVKPFEVTLYGFSEEGSGLRQ